MKVIYFGTPEFSAQVLDYLLQSQINVVAVISKPDKPKGRSGNPVATPVKSLVQSRYSHIPIFQPEVVSSSEFSSILSSFAADLFIVVAYGEILRQPILDIPRLACINLHTSLLPKYRGAAPIQRCIIEGETESGVTIMHMVRKMDAGNIIAKEIVPIGPNITFGELEQELCAVGKKTLLKVIKNSEIPVGEPQNELEVTLAPKIELEDCQIDWNRSAQAIHNLVRGVNPYPLAWVFINLKGEKKRLKIIRTALISSDTANALKAAQVSGDTKQGFIVGTGSAALKLLEVQLEGKKAMSGEEFLRGNPSSSLSL